MIQKCLILGYYIIEKNNLQEKTGTINYDTDNFMGRGCNAA